MNLKKSWDDAWQKLGVSETDDHVFDQLIQAYQEPGRHYHTLQHLEECLSRLDEYKQFACRPEEIAIALWFHDAVYDTSKSDNEKKSAEWAQLALADQNLAPEVIERIQKIIMGTLHKDVPVDIDACLMLDIDLSILGESQSRFEEYEAQIGKEYGWVPRPVFRFKRAGLLKKLLARQSIFLTEHFRVSYESQARKNLTHAIRALSFI